MSKITDLRDLIKRQPALLSECLSAERLGFHPSHILAARTEAGESAAAAWALFCDPSTRVQSLVAWYKNGTVSQERNVIGGYGPTWCGKWPKTKAAAVWAAEQRADFSVKVEEVKRAIAQGVRFC